MSNWKWNIRSANGDDLNFIYSTWLNSYWSDSQRDQGVPGPIFFSEYPRVIDYLLADKDTKVIVACGVDDPLVIYGYLVATPPVAHYAFTKKIFFKYGIAKSLMQYLKCNGTHTHQTNSFKSIIKNKEGFIYNPYFLIKKGEPNGTEEQSAS